jgi:PAS domain S-box-containing protein
MSVPPLTLALRDAALAQQVARWLSDEGIAHRFRQAGVAFDPATDQDVWLTDVAALRESLSQAPGARAVPARPDMALVVLGDALSWDDRALATKHGAVEFVGLPLSREALLGAVQTLVDGYDALAAAVLLFGASDTPTARAAGALAGAGMEVHVESDPRHLFERMRVMRPDVLVLMPGIAEAPVSRVLRMIRSDRAWDDVMLLCVVPDPSAAADLPSGASALIEPVAPDVLARAVSDRARRRRTLAALSPLHPLLALQDQERRALDAHALVSIADSRGHIVYANDHFCRTSGYRRSELLGRDHRIVKSGVHPPEVYAELWRTVAGGDIWQGELCNRRKDGSLYWVATTIMPVGDAEGGSRRYLSIRTDITAAKQVQFSLRRRVRQQRALAAIARRLMGYDRAQLLRSAPTLLRLGGRLVGATHVQWTSPPSETTSLVVAEWWLRGRADAGRGGSALPSLVTPVGPGPEVGGQLNWWLDHGQASLQASDETFAHALASILGSAWFRTAAELARRASQLALNDMLQAFPGIAAVAGEDMVYEFANAPYARLYGLAPDQVIGRRHADLAGPEADTQIRQRREVILREGRPLTLEQSLMLPGEGGPHVFSVVHFVTGGRDGIPRRFFQVGIDITERRRMADRLESLLEQTQSEAWLQRLIAALATDLGAASAQTLDGLTDALLRDVGSFFEVDRMALFLVSPDGLSFSNTREWCAQGVPPNGNMLQLLPVDSLPWTRQKLLDEKLPAHVPDVDDMPGDAAADQVTLRGLGLRSALSVPILADGRVAGFVRLDSIRQHRSWSESAIRSLGILGQVVGNALHRVHTEQTLMGLKERAEAASAAKSDFLASMSHELRTPLNAVLGFGQLLELMLEQKSKEQAYVQEILKGGRHLLTLIDDVLDLARIESGRVDLSLEPIALSDIADECMHLMQPLADRRGIRIAMEVGEHAMLADRLRLKQVLLNLLSNAIKYNVAGGRVQVSATQSAPRRVRVEVRDTGVGISVERQQELFQPFNRLGAETGAIEGTGIGLVLVRRLVGLMDGQVGAISAPGQGSTFWFDLPGPPPGTGRMAAAVRESAFTDLQAVADKRVLYIDDNPSNLRLMQSVLARWPAVMLLTAQDPRLGLELAEAHRPDIVLLDIQMTPLDGYQVLRRLRRHPELSQVPVVAITANVMPRDIARAKAAGFDECLTKPFDVRGLLSVLEKHLRHATLAELRDSSPS